MGGFFLGHGSFIQERFSSNCCKHYQTHLFQLTCVVKSVEGRGNVHIFFSFFLESLLLFVPHLWPLEWSWWEGLSTFFGCMVTPANWSNCYRHHTCALLPTTHCKLTCWLQLSAAFKSPFSEGGDPVGMAETAINYININNQTIRFHMLFLRYLLTHIWQFNMSICTNSPMFVLAGGF